MLESGIWATAAVGIGAIACVAVAVMVGSGSGTVRMLEDVPVTWPLAAVIAVGGGTSVGFGLLLVDVTGVLLDKVGLGVAGFKLLDVTRVGLGVAVGFKLDVTGVLSDKVGLVGLGVGFGLLDVTGDKVGLGVTVGFGLLDVTGVLSDEVGGVAVGFGRGLLDVTDKVAEGLGLGPGGMAVEFPPTVSLLEAVGVEGGVAVVFGGGGGSVCVGGSTLVVIGSGNGGTGSPQIAPMEQHPVRLLASLISQNIL